MVENLPIKFNNYQECLLGVGQSFANVVYVYDREKIIEKIMTQMQCPYKEALYFFENNINKDYGRRGPIFFAEINQINV